MSKETDSDYREGTDGERNKRTDREGGEDKHTDQKRGKETKRV